ncbi:MAG: tetratricopeptide repeat protein [Cyanobacteria bacterium J06607_10]
MIAIQPKSRQILGVNQQAYQALKATMSLNLRRQLLIAVCDSTPLQAQLAAQLEADLSLDAVSMATPATALDSEFNGGFSSGLSGGGDGGFNGASAVGQSVALERLMFDPDDAHLPRQVANWVRQKMMSGQPLPQLQMLGVEQMTRQPAIVQNHFLRSLEKVEALLPRLNTSLLVWVPWPWLRTIQASSPTFWKWRSGVFEFVSDPTPTAAGLAHPELDDDDDSFDEALAFLSEQETTTLDYSAGADVGVLAVGVDGAADNTPVSNASVSNSSVSNSSVSNSSVGDTATGHDDIANEDIANDEPIAHNHSSGNGYGSYGNGHSNSHSNGHSNGHRAQVSPSDFVDDYSDSQDPQPMGLYGESSDADRPILLDQWMAEVVEHSPDRLSDSSSSGSVEPSVNLGDDLDDSFDLDEDIDLDSEPSADIFAETETAGQFSSAEAISGIVLTPVTVQPAGEGSSSDTSEGDLVEGDLVSEEATVNEAELASEDALVRDENNHEHAAARKFYTLSELDYAEHQELAYVDEILLPDLPEIADGEDSEDFSEVHSEDAQHTLLGAANHALEKTIVGDKQSGDRDAIDRDAIDRDSIDINENESADHLLSDPVNPAPIAISDLAPLPLDDSDDEALTIDDSLALYGLEPDADALPQRLDAVSVEDAVSVIEVEPVKTVETDWVSQVQKLDYSYADTVYADTVAQASDADVMNSAAKPGESTVVESTSAVSRSVESNDGNIREGSSPDDVGSHDGRHSAADDYFAVGYRYRSRIESGERGLDLIERAIAAYEGGLRCLSGPHPDWGSGLNDLGTLYWLKAQQLDNPQQEVDCMNHSLELYQQALTKIDGDREAEMVSQLYSNMGAVYSILATYSEPAAYFNQAIAAYRAAIERCAMEIDPIEYATLYNSLGSVYWKLSHYEQVPENLEQAVSAYNQALPGYDASQMPLDYAAVQNNLGITYWSLAKHVAAVPALKRAIAAYRDALKYRTPEVDPAACAITYNNLALAYWDLSKEEDIDSDAKLLYQKNAITAFEAALQTGGGINALSQMDSAAIYHCLGDVHAQMAEGAPSTQAIAESLQKSLYSYVKAIEGLDEDSSVYQARLSAMVANLKAHHERLGQASQQAALNRIPSELLSQVMMML